MTFRVTLCAAVVAAFFALGYPPAAAVAADDAAAVLARHAAYVGQPQGLALTYRYTPASSARSAPSAPTPKGSPAPSFPPAVQTIYRRGALYREIYEHGGVSSQDGFTGRAFWSANENGYTVVDLENRAREMLTANVIDGDLLTGVEARSRPGKTIDGIPVDVVRISPVSGVPADIAFDHATGAYVEVTVDPDNGYDRYSYRVDGYTEIAPGIRVQSGYHTGENGRWKLTEHSVRAVSNEDMRGPVPSAKWNFASTDTTAIAVVEHQTPYAFLPRGQAVHVRATIGGQTGTFLLDSGASGIILYQPYAGRLGLTMLGRTGFSGINGGAVAARYARAASIAVGPNVLSNVVVEVADGKYSGGIDGILGYDFLAGAIVDVDTAAQTIRILDPGAYQPTVTKGAYAFPVNLASRQPEIALKVGGVATRAIFDTGDDFLAVVSDDLQRSGRLVALNDKLALGGGLEVEYEIGFYGVDGPSNVPARCSRLNQIEVGPYRYQNVETCFAPASVFGRDGGLIGFDFLRHFNWTFDYPEATLVLTPNGK
jgi:predicted aspartyl protease